MSNVIPIKNMQINYPDVNDKGKILDTADNLEILLNKNNIYYLYDVILKESKIDIKDIAQDHDLTEQANILSIKSMAKCEGISGAITDNLPVVLLRNSINPVLDFIKSKDWDGLTRIESLCKTITLHDTSDSYRNKILRYWLVQCVAAADGAESTPNVEASLKYELVLTLQGDQGLKKTSWIRSLLPRALRKYILDGVTLDVDNKDSIKHAISGWIVELGELDSTYRKSDIAKIKSFLSSGVDIIRMPYALAHSKFKRRASFCASVNEHNFLVDETGNRRFAAFKVKAIDADHWIDMQQLWAEVYKLYIDGHKWWLDNSEMAEFNENNAKHVKINPVEGALEDEFDLSLVNQGSLLSCTEIAKICGLAKNGVSKANLNSIATVLRNKGFDMEKTKTKRGFYITQLLVM